MTGSRHNYLGSHRSYSFLHLNSFQNKLFTREHVSLRSVTHKKMQEGNKNEETNIAINNDYAII